MIFTINTKLAARKSVPDGVRSTPKPVCRLSALFRIANLVRRMALDAAQAFAAVLCIFALAHNSQAAIRYWDTTTTAGLGVGGTNDWTTPGIWSSSSSGAAGSNVNWVTGDSGIFNGNGIVGVTVNSPISAAGTTTPAVVLGTSPTSGTSTTVNFSGTSTLTITTGYFGVGWTTAANASTATVIFNQSSGTIDATASGVEIGRFGTNATYALSGGTLNYSGIFRMANQVFNGTGSVAPVALLNITGGTFSGTGQALIGSATASRNATATVNVSGTGTFSVGNLALAGPSGNATATINLNGGTIKATNITQGAGGTGTFNFNGGELYARQDNSVFMTGLTRANVRNGGAKINTDSFAITIGQALLHSNIGGDDAIDSGLTKLGSGTLTLAGTNTYTGATAVGAGTLALDSAGSINSSSSIAIDTGAIFDVSAQSNYAMSGLQPFTFSLDGTGAGSAGLLAAAGLDITSAMVNFDIVNPLDDNVYVLATYSNLTGIQFASVTAPTGYSIDYAYNGGTQIALTAIPEPSTLALLGVGTLGLLHGVRRRRMVSQ